jgi:hypothetical protein
MPRSSTKPSLRLSRVYDSMEKAEKLLPAAIAKLGTFIEDEETTPVELCAIVKTLSGISRSTLRADKELGLSQRSSAGSTSPLLVLLGSDTKVGDLRRLSHEDKEKLFFAALENDKQTVKDILPETVVDAG